MTTLFLPRVLLLTGAATWSGVCVATLWAAPRAPLLLFWSASATVFIISFFWTARTLAPSPLILALQSASVVTMVALLCNGYEGLLLVLVAAQLALSVNSREAIIWIFAQTVLLGIAIAVHWSLRPSLLLTPPYLGFQLLVFAAIRLFAQERRAKDDLTQANASLRQYQIELADKARIEERLRIAQDLHDVLGHHLTALSMNLELAAHDTSGSTRTIVYKAQALARALLQDVKALVRSASDDAPVDLPRELRQLAQELPSPRVHVECPDQLEMPDPAISRALLRVTQEVVTNAIRHGDAQNLWISIEPSTDRVTLLARDDGRGGANIMEGFGLSGMRRRLEQLGGTLLTARSAAGGFEVRAILPLTRKQAA